MDLLIAACVTVLTQIFKKLSNKFGYQIVENFTLFVAFVFSLLGTFLFRYYTKTLDWTNWQDLVNVFGVSVAYFEIVVKRIIVPIFTPIEITIAEISEVRTTAPDGTVTVTPIDPTTAPETQATGQTTNQQ